MNEERTVIRDMTSAIYPWSCVTQIFRNVSPSHGEDSENFEVILWNLFTLFLFVHIQIEILQPTFSSNLYQCY